jgi:aconitate hydratase
MFKTESDYDGIDSGDEIQIPNIRKVISKNEPLIVKNLTTRKDFEVNYELSERQRNILLAGGMLSYIKNK